MNKILLSLAFLAACDRDYTLAERAQILAERQANMQAYFDSEAELLGDRLSEPVVEVLANMRITTTAFSSIVKCNDTLAAGCSGYDRRGWFIDFFWSAEVCVESTALAHEQAHLYRCGIRRCDTNHEDLEFWKIVNTPSRRCND